MIREGRDALIRALGPGGKAIGRAALVGGNPALAENNIVSPSVKAFNNWLSQVGNPTTTITPSGEDIGEVLLSHKANSLGRTPTKWFDGYIRSLSAVPGSKSMLEKAADKWECNFAQFGALAARARYIGPAVLWFVGNYPQFSKIPSYLMDIAVNDGVNDWKASIGKQIVGACTGIITRTLYKMLAAEQVGVSGAEVDAFVSDQQNRINSIGGAAINSGTFRCFFNTTPQTNVRILITT